jgi:arylsulfatase
MIPYTGPSLARTINRWYNNELDNIGEPDSFVWYGSHWAQAATA